MKGHTERPSAACRLAAAPVAPDPLCPAPARSPRQEGHKSRRKPGTTRTKRNASDDRTCQRSVRAVVNRGPRCDQDKTIRLNIQAHGTLPVTPDDGEVEAGRPRPGRIS